MQIVNQAVLGEVCR